MPLARARARHCSLVGLRRARRLVAEHGLAAERAGRRLAARDAGRASHHVDRDDARLERVLGRGSALWLVGGTRSSTAKTSCIDIAMRCSCVSLEPALRPVARAVFLCRPLAHLDALLRARVDVCGTGSARPCGARKTIYVNASPWRRVAVRTRRPWRCAASPSDCLGGTALRRPCLGAAAPRADSLLRA